MAILEGEKPYKEGTIKLTWVNKKDYKLLNSKMFDSVEDAVNYAKDAGLGKDYLIMELRATDGDEYTWTVLPYGDHKTYVNGMKISDNLPLQLLAGTFMVLGIVYVGKMIFAKK